MATQQEVPAKHSPGNPFFEYRGTIFDGRVTPKERVRAIQSYDDVRDDDVIICTYPKAGTHWTADIVLKIMCDGNIQKSALRDAGDVAYEFEFPAGVDMQKLTGRKLAAPTLAALSELPSPRIIVTHLLFDMLPQKVQEGRAKVIYVYRDPRDTAVSFWHHLQTMKQKMGAPQEPWDSWLETYMHDKTPFGLWSRHFKSFQDAREQREMLVIYYEKMKEDLKGAISTIGKFLGKELCDGQLDALADSCSIESAKAANPNSIFVRKGVARGWASHFTVSQSERFDAHMDNEITTLGLDTPYWPHSQILLAPDEYRGQVYRFQGVNFQELIMPFSRVKEVYSYDDVRPDDVIIWTCPKSGTHWASDIAAKVLFNGDLEKVRVIERDLVTFEITPTPHTAEKINGPAPMSLRELSDISSPRVIMTHLPFRMLPRRIQRGEAKIIYVHRDVRDVAVSRFHHLTDISGWSITWERFFEMFLSGDLSAASWWSMSKDFEANKTKGNILALQYEEALNNLKGTVKKVAEFLNKNLDEQTIDRISDSCTFAESKKAKPLSPFLRKGKSGGWKSYFTVQQLELLDRRCSKLKLNLNLHA